MRFMLLHIIWSYTRTELHVVVKNTKLQIAWEVSQAPTHKIINIMLDSNSAFLYSVPCILKSYFK